MTRKELQRKLDEIGVKRHHYCLFGDIPGDCLIMDHMGGHPGYWIVFSWERRQRFDLREFNSESEACKHMWELLKDDEGARS